MPKILKEKNIINEGCVKIKDVLVAKINKCS